MQKRRILESSRAGDEVSARDDTSEPGKQQDDRQSEVSGWRAGLGAAGTGATFGRLRSSAFWLGSPRDYERSRAERERKRKAGRERGYYYKELMRNERQIGREGAGETVVLKSDDKCRVRASGS